MKKILECALLKLEGLFTDKEKELWNTQPLVSQLTDDWERRLEEKMEKEFFSKLK